MKTSPHSFRRRLILLPPLVLCLGVMGWSGLFRGGDAGEAVAEQRSGAEPEVLAREAEPVVRRAAETRENVREAGRPEAVPGGLTGLGGAGAAFTGSGSVKAWEVRADAVAVSHWAPGTGGAAPQRSGRLVGDFEGWERAGAGSEVEFPLFDGETARGTVRRTVETEPGARFWSGRLSQPEGTFFVERNDTGWRGYIMLSGQPVAYRIFPGREGNAGPWLERWAREAVECAQVGDSSYDPDEPAVDPGLTWSNLESRPGTFRVVYLDFNGGTVSDTFWNSDFHDDETIHFAASSLSDEDRIRAWARAAEDFRAFQVNVTTSLSTYQAAGSTSRVRVAITPTKWWYGDDEDEDVKAKGGVGRVGSFGDSGAVVWVWNSGWLSAAETISHEVGHAMGLFHSGFLDVESFVYEEYYRGHGTGATGWAPIMGFSADEARYLTSWDNGSYPAATSNQDQKGVLSVVLSPEGDDHGGSTASATTLPPQGTGPTFEGSGRLELSTDVDYFRLQLTEEYWVFEATANPFGKNVNLTLQIRDASNTLIHEADLPNSCDVLTSKGLTAGTYYLTVKSTARAATADDPGYPRYGQLGSYTVTARPLGYEGDPPVVLIQEISGFVLGSTHADVKVRYTDAWGVDTDTLGNSDVTRRLEGSQLAMPGQLVSMSGVNRELFVTYRFFPPGGTWDIGDGGNWLFGVAAGAVKDRNGNSNVAVVKLAVLPDTDADPPQVTVVGALPNASEGDTEYTFRIACEDIAPVAVSENGKNCVEIRRVTAGEGAIVSGPITAQRTGAASSNYNKNWTVDYKFPAPGGVWDESDLGKYEVWLRPLKVRDVNGNQAPSQRLGSFFLRKRLWLRTFEESGPVALFGQDSGWSVGTPQGTGASSHDPSGAYSGEKALGFRLGSGDAALYQNGMQLVRYATSPAVNVTGYSGISLQFRRWLSARAGDTAVIQASRDGTGWTTVWRNPPDTTVYGGFWELTEVALPAEIADNAEGLRFRFGMGPTDGENTAGGWTLDDLKIIASGYFNPGRLILSNVATAVTEGAQLSRIFTVRLDQAPTSAVTVEIDPGSQLATTRSSITFTAANYATPVNVTLSAVDDLVVEGDHFGALVLKVSSAATDPAFMGVRNNRLVQVTDNDNALIQTQPVDQAVAPGQSAVFRVVPISTSLKTYQWYLGNRGDTSSPVNGATQATASVTLPAGSTQPMSLWVRVQHGITNVREDSAVALLSPLKGYAAWKALLRQHGYTAAQLDEPGFDDEDPDRDGLSHFMEYAFGGQPYTADQGLLPVLSVGRSAGTGGGKPGLPLSQAGKEELVLTFGPARQDVRYTTEISGDLERWQVYKSSVADSGSLIFRAVGGNTVVSVPMSGAQQFVRVRVAYTGE